MEDTNYEWAMRTLKSGWKVRLPEWRGYWFADQDNRVWALTKDGEYKPAFTEDPGYKERTDWEIANGLDFGWAICALKAGKKVARKGWNGKKMFLFLLPAGTVPTKAIHDPALRMVIEREVGGDTFEALGSIRMFTADKKILTGWLASQTDMLADDWELVN